VLIPQINFIAKAEGFPDAPVILPGHEFQPFDGMSINRPEVHGHLKEMYQEVISVSNSRS
jgi:alpha-glucosidase